jgi:hypothetical protein
MTLEEKAQKVGKDCLTIGMAIAVQGESVKKRVACLRIINVVVSMAVFVTLVPQFSAV